MSKKWEDVAVEEEPEVGSDEEISVPTSPNRPDEPSVTTFPDGSTKTVTVRRLTETRTKGESRVRTVKKVKTTVVNRPYSMGDARQSWDKFGAGMNNEPGLTLTESGIPLELGGTDPDERRARDQVIKLMNLSLNAPVKIANIRKSALTTAQATNQTVANQATSSTAEEPEISGGAKTWAAARQTKKEKEQAAVIASGETQKTNNVIRISNLTDEITEAEVRRLFGPDNVSVSPPLGHIKRLFIAKDASGTRRGFAYVTYESEALAARAVAAMHRKAFKHVILLVDYGTERGRR